MDIWGDQEDGTEEEVLLSSEGSDVEDGDAEESRTQLEFHFKGCSVSRTRNFGLWNLYSSGLDNLTPRECLGDICFVEMVAGPLIRVFCQCFPCLCFPCSCFPCVLPMLVLPMLPLTLLRIP